MKSNLKKRLRVCMIVYAFYEIDGRVIRYAEALANRGDEVDIIALNVGNLPARDKINGVNILRIQNRSYKERAKLTFLVKLLSFFMKSAFVVSIRHLRNPYHLIHVHSVPDFEVFAALLPRLFGAKVILDIHDIVPELYASKFNVSHDGFIFRMLKLVEKLSTWFAHHVIIANDIWYKRICSRSVDSAKCSVIMNYPDTSIFRTRTRDRRDDKIILLYPGTLSLHQGLDTAIEAFSRISHQVAEAEFHIYGEGTAKSILEDMIVKRKLQGRITIHNALPMDQIAIVMANADLGIEPKKNDPFAGDAFSMKILEFMAVGVPVIASSTRVHEYYFNDKVLTFFPSGDAKALADAMLLLINDKTLRVGQRGRALAFVEKFTWDRHKYSYLRLVDSLVNNANKRALR